MSDRPTLPPRPELSFEEATKRFADIAKEQVAHWQDRAEKAEAALAATAGKVVAPTVFNLPADAIDASLVSVMMPFAPDFNSSFETIKAACAAAELTCLRADDIWENSTVIQDIFSLIFRSSFVVCDFSGRNPNVLYEAGIAHTLGRHVIPITQNSNDIPFDLLHHRFVLYANSAPGLSDLKEKLTKRLMALAGGHAI